MSPNEQLFTPPPSPPRTLSSSINAATRTQHTHLNQLITRLLPLALPPNTTNPLLYGRGLRVFAEIFFIIEGCWEWLCEDPPPPIATVVPYRTVAHDARVKNHLIALIPDHLRRSKRIKDDLLHICRSNNQDLPLSSSQRSMAKSMAFSIMAKPHTLLAYAWVMYMAVFSGGRYIRRELASAGPEFWLQQPCPAESEKAGQNSLLELSGFTFLSFDGAHDGEDVKDIFKDSFAKADAILTEQEKDDVVEASQQLFENCITLVGMLDRREKRRLLVRRILPLGVGMLSAFFFGLAFWYRFLA